MADKVMPAHETIPSMEAIRSQDIDGEQVYVISAIGATPEVAEQEMPDARCLHAQEYVLRHYEARQYIGGTVDIEL